MRFALLRKQPLWQGLPNQVLQPWYCIRMLISSPISWSMRAVSGPEANRSTGNPQRDIKQEWKSATTWRNNLQKQRVSLMAIKKTNVVANSFDGALCLTDTWPPNMKELAEVIKCEKQLGFRRFGCKKGSQICQPISNLLSSEMQHVSGINYNWERVHTIHQPISCKMRPYFTGISAHLVDLDHKFKKFLYLNGVSSVCRTRIIPWYPINYIDCEIRAPSSSVLFLITKCGANAFCLPSLQFNPLWRAPDDDMAKYCHHPTGAI